MPPVKSTLQSRTDLVVGLKLCTWPQGPTFRCRVFSFYDWEDIWRTLDNVSDAVTLTLTLRPPRPDLHTHQAHQFMSEPETRALL